MDWNVLREDVGVKELGVTTNAKLSFNAHITEMCAKAGKQLNALQILKKSLHLEIWLTIYKGFITSKFKFCPVVCMFTAKSSLSKLQDIWKRALQCELCDYSSRYDELLLNASVALYKNNATLIPHNRSLQVHEPDKSWLLQPIVN